MSNHRAYQTNPVISNILMRKTCSKTNKPARLTTIKQHFASHNIKHGYLKINLFASAPQPPPKILAASPLPTGHTVPSPTSQSTPGIRCPELGARTSSQPRSCTPHNTRARHTYRALPGRTHLQTGIWRETRFQKERVLVGDWLMRCLRGVEREKERKGEV